MFNSQKGARNESLMEDLYFLNSQNNLTKLKGNALVNFDFPDIEMIPILVND